MPQYQFSAGIRVNTNMRNRSALLPVESYFVPLLKSVVSLQTLSLSLGRLRLIIMYAFPSETLSFYLLAQKTIKKPRYLLRTNYIGKKQNSTPSKDRAVVQSMLLWAFIQPVLRHQQHLGMENFGRVH